MVPFAVPVTKIVYVPGGAGTFLEVGGGDGGADMLLQPIMSKRSTTKLSCIIRLRLRSGNPIKRINANVAPTPACCQPNPPNGRGRFDAALRTTTKALTASVVVVLPLTMGVGGFTAQPMLLEEGEQASASGKLEPSTPVRLIVTVPD